MTIKQVGSQYGLRPDTLRYYEKVGVIPEVHRTESGIRDYDDVAIGWVENAVCMRSAGVPVESIIEYVRLYQAGDTTLQARHESTRSCWRKSNRWKLKSTVWPIKSDGMMRP